MVEKLLDYYAGLHAPQLSPSTSIERENETSPPKGLLQRFEEFVRETKDNFIVINTSLKDKDREIKELKSKLFLAEETIKELQDALQYQIGRNVPHGLATTLRQEKTLLIGDSGLKEVKADDLHENVLVRTLPEANMDLLKSWIEEKLDYSLCECIIYCGTQDLLDDDVPVERVLDGLGSAIAELKRKNSDINVKVCELIPSRKLNGLQDRINLYNVKLHDWCTDNGVTVINTGDFFRLGTGDLDVNCYECHNERV